MEEFGLKSTFEASAASESETAEAVVLEGKEAVPVAFAPAFVVKPHPTKLANGQERFEVAVVDPDQVENAIALAKAREDASLVTIERERANLLIARSALEDQLRQMKEPERVQTEAAFEAKYPRARVVRDAQITLDRNEWTFKLGKAAKSNTEVTASKPSVYRRLLGVEKEI